MYIDQKHLNVNWKVLWHDLEIEYTLDMVFRVWVCIYIWIILYVGCIYL